MNKEISLRGQMSVPDMMTMAKTFADSGIFTDIKQAAQAFVKMQAGQEMGIPPFAAITGIHIIQGKPTVGAGLMAATVKASGKYNYKVIALTAEECSLDFYEGKEMLGNSTFTIKDALKADTKNISKFPKNMLFARAMSNGVKWYTPDIFAGPVYTPEEMETVDVPHTVVVDPVDYTNSLQECGSLEDLGKAWAVIPAERKPEYFDLKEELKKSLSNPIEEAVVEHELPETLSEQDPVAIELYAATTPAELAKVWKKIPADSKETYLSLKDTLKATLS